MKTGIKFNELIDKNVDANDNTYTSAPLNVGLNEKVSLQVVGVSGAHTTHVFKLQESADKSNWVDVTSGSVTGEGLVTNLSVTTKWVRVAEPTAEGGASVVNVIVQGK